jgi:sugar/nucleoside kinase (ribokinase family)
VHDGAGQDPENLAGDAMSILVIGSVALDSVQTPFGKRKEILGGSATYFSIAASLFDEVHLVATVGEDFPPRYLNTLKKKGVGLEGLEVARGKTFRWRGRYDYDLNVAHTISTELNVFKEFKPRVPEELKDSKFVFLANIDPHLQLDVLRQVRRPGLVACDSMNFWIANKRRGLEKVLAEADIFLMNDSEARQLSGETNLLGAARRIVSAGPRAVIIKKGEHGALYVSKRSHFIVPAYPLESLYDPTGAGDTFAGGLMGFLSRCGRTDEPSIRKAIVYGSIMASFAVEDFSVNRLLAVSMADVNARYRHFEKITRF